MAVKTQAQEIETFARDAPRWWDEFGPFAPLQKMNPVRMGWIRRALCDHFGLSQTDLKPFKGLRALDVGCGGGLACESMARLGADVTGIDADEVAIGVAREHAAAAELKIDYRVGMVGDESKKYDIVLALEIIEHVDDAAAFMADCARVLKPDGMAVFSTLNRTAKSYALGIVAAEYILGWVPRGTHDWNKFVKPSEMADYMARADLTPAGLSGVIYNPIKGGFVLDDKDVRMNYLMTAVRN